MQQHWCVCKAETQRELIAQRHLERGGFETYYPRIKVAPNIVRRDGRSHLAPRIEPLFRSYLFVRIAEQWHAVRRTIGVTAVLLNGERPAVIGDPYIDELRSREGPDGLVRLLRQRPEFMPGDRVQITSGLMQGRFAIFQGMAAHERVLVPLAVLGSERRVQLDRQHVMRA
jgi:transcriptional antiterminator RfaH